MDYNDVVRPFGCASIEDWEKAYKQELTDFFKGLEFDSDTSETSVAFEDEIPVETNTLLDSRFSELDQTEINRVQEILLGPWTEDVIQDKYNTEITKRKLKCLGCETWLNDEVINFYMNMLQQRDISLCMLNKNRRKSHFFNSFFVERLLVTDGCYKYESVKRWTKTFTIFEMDKMFFPINICNSHWTLAVVYPPKKRIEYFDSSGGNGQIYRNGLLRWIKDEADKNGLCLIIDEWTTYSRSHEIPQQVNDWDCGMFAIIAADFLSDNLPLHYTQNDMPSFRLKVGLRILNGCLEYPLYSST